LPIGYRVERGDPLFTVHAQTAEMAEKAVADVRAAYRFSDTTIPPKPLILDFFQ
jgi:thymidine phosphorylase